MDILTNKYDNLFKNNIPNTVENVKIFNKDDKWKIKQDYKSVSNKEINIWGELFSNVIDYASKLGTSEFREGLLKLNLTESRFPNIKKISKTISNLTNWEIVVVAGFLDEFLFFQLNSKRKFPSTDIIRKSSRFNQKYISQPIKNKFGYTPEPDIFHDVFGHMPFLTDQSYCNFMADIGKLGSDILKNKKKLPQDLVIHNLKRLQNFAWWTYEFGIMVNQNDNPNNNLDYQIYGAGILSSYDEILNIINCSKGICDRSIFIPYDINEIVLTKFDYSEIQNRYFVINSMDQLYDSFKYNQELFFYEG